MVVVNATERVIQRSHATNSCVNTWCRDLLGSNVLSQGQRYAIDFDDGTGSCQFDFRAVLDNGRVVEQYSVNVCTATEWIVSLALPILAPGSETGPGGGAALFASWCLPESDPFAPTLVRLLPSFAASRHQAVRQQPVSSDSFRGLPAPAAAPAPSPLGVRAYTQLCRRGDRKIRSSQELGR